MSNTDFPLVMTSAGAQQTPPATILAMLIAAVVAVDPGYTANLPASLIEDISSTDVAAIAQCNSAMVEAVNSLTPYGANAFLLSQLGNIYGVSLAPENNTSVYVVFSSTSFGFVIPDGFVVSDGTYQYICQNGGIIGAGGTSLPIFAVAVLPGIWSIPSGTVTQLITSVPSIVSLSVSNPTTGTPGSGAETQEQFQARVLQAGLAVSQGLATTLRTALNQIPGVQARLISVLQNPNNGGWEIICGGGDPYQVAYAIYDALFDINTLTGSSLVAQNITAANPGVVTANLSGQYTSGQSVALSNSNPATYDGIYVITVTGENTFSLGVDTTSYGAYNGGAIITPNYRTIDVSINDYPNTYVIPFVNPPQQTVAITLTWNSTANNIGSPAAVAQLGNTALVNYVNGITAGQPMNLFELQTTFQQAIASIVPPALLTRMIFSVSINGIGVSPETGTGIIAGDAESYFETNSSLVTITKG